MQSLRTHSSDASQYEKKITLKFQNFQLKREIYEKSIFYEEADYGLVQHYIFQWNIVY